MTQIKQRKAVGSAWRLLQYCQVPDKNILRHWRDVWNVTLLFRKFYLFIYSVISRAEPLTMLCGTLVGKHWPREN
jgi:hypothetical protein